MPPHFVSPIGVSPPTGVTIFAVAATIMLSAILHTPDLAANPWVTGMKMATLAYFLWQAVEHALAGDEEAEQPKPRVYCPPSGGCQVDAR